MKTPILLIAFGVCATILGLFLCPSPKREDKANDQLASSYDQSPTKLSQEPGSVVSEERPATFSLRGGYMMQGGVEIERSFLGEVRDWARAHPDAAIAWAQQQPDSDEARKEALTDACFQIVQTQPQRAILVAEQFRLSKHSVLENLAQQWATKDLPSACQWIAEQSDDDQRNALVTGAASVWSEIAPVGAAQFVVDQMSPGSARDAAILMVLQQWASKDVAGARAWIQQFPEGPLRDQALEELATVTHRDQSTMQ